MLSEKGKDSFAEIHESNLAEIRERAMSDVWCHKVLELVEHHGVPWHMAVTHVFVSVTEQLKLCQKAAIRRLEREVFPGL